MKTTYDIIQADPPYKYNNRGFDDRMRGGAMRHYPTMDPSEIAKLPIAPLAKKNALLFLWGTWPMLYDSVRRSPNYKGKKAPEDVLTIMHGWGFNYATGGFLWVKTNKGKKQCWKNLYDMLELQADDRNLKALGNWIQAGFFFGNGFYPKANTEFCLICRKGKALKPVRDDVSQLIVAPVGEHSEKPWEAYHRINKMYPDTKKLELFSRKKRPGWDCWGNEIDSDLKIEAQ